MSRRRGFSIAGPAAAMLLLAAACTGPGAQQLVGLAPATAVSVVSVDMAAILADEDIVALIVEEDGGPLDADQIFAGLEEATGIDWRQTAEVLLFTLPLPQWAPEDGPPSEDLFPEFAVMARLTDPEDLTAALREELGDALVESEYREARLLAAEDDLVFFGIIPEEEGGIAVIGSEEAVRGVIDVHAGEAEALSGPMLEQYEAFDGAWVRGASLPVGTQGGMPAAMSGLSGLVGLDSLPEADVSGYALHKEDGVLRVTLEAHYADEESAREARKASEALVTFARLFMEDEGLDGEDAAALAPLLDEVTVSRDGASVTIRFEGPFEALASLVTGDGGF